MYNFNYHNPVKVIFGKNTIPQIKNEIPAKSRILITYGSGSIKNNGIYKQAMDALSSFTTFEFGGIEPNPEYETLMKAVKIIKDKNIDFLLAIGGGSVLDGTKFIAAAAYHNGEEAWDILSKGATVKKAITLSCIMTLPATGSEMNSFAVISRREIKQKLAFGSPFLFPKFSVLDPLFLQSLPQKQKANGVADAFIHVLEQYLTFPNQAEIQDRWAEGLLLTLLQFGKDYVYQDYNYHTSANIMWAATCALNGMIGSGVPHDWATHAIGHELTALFELDHAETLVIILPGMIRAMKKEKEEKLKRFALHVFGIKTENYSIDRVVKSTENFFQSLGMKTRLSDFHINEKDFVKIINNLSKGKAINLGEQGLVNEKKVLEILNYRL